MSKTCTLALAALALLGTTALASANIGRLHAAAGGGARVHAAEGGGERLHAAAGGGGARFRAAAGGGIRFRGPIREINHDGCGAEGCVAHAGGPIGRPHLPCEVRCGEPLGHDHDHDHDDHDHDGHGPIVWGGPHANWYVGWHRAHWFAPGVAVSTGVSAAVSTPVSAGVAASPAVASQNCNCLTKQYLQDGSVLFKDVCTKEAALATPDELKAQAQGTPMQGD